MTPAIPPRATPLRLRPVTQREAKDFVARIHRHNEAPIQWVFAVGVESDGVLVGVAIAERPKARMSNDGSTLEVTRVATDGTRNACSMLYGACTRAAKALGYMRLLTYTLESESGASLKASGWSVAASTMGGRTWEEERGGNRIQRDLFGERRMPTGPKMRWEKAL